MQNQKVIITNFHTPYTLLLCEVFKNNFVYRDFDRSQVERNLEINSINLLVTIKYLTMSDTVLISNRAVSDLLLIISHALRRKRTVIVVHGNLRHGAGSNYIGYLIKKTLYKAIYKMIPNIKIVTIADHAKKELGIKDCLIVRPFVVQSNLIPANNNKLVVSSNSIWRNHFDIELLRKIKQLNIFDIYIVGKDNESLSDDFRTVQFNDKDSYFAFLRSARYTLNILKEPESNYNMSFLDCLCAGLIPIWRFRQNNEIPLNARPEQILSNDDFINDTIYEKMKYISDKSNEHILLESSKSFLQNFSQDEFRLFWHQICI